jgi:hypothetical protein
MILGLELTRHTLRGVMMDRPRVGPPPDRFVEIPFTPDEDGLPPSEALEEAVRALGGETGTVAVAVPTAWCRYRIVRFPYRSPGRIESTLRYALEGRLPGPIEEYTIEPLGPPMDEPDGGASVLVAACPTGRIEKLLARLRAAGLDPAAVAPVPIALAFLASDGEGGGSLIVRQGPDGTDLALCDGGRLLAAGGVPVLEGESDLQRRVARVRRTLELWRDAEGLPRPERVRLISSEAEDGTFANALREALQLPVDRLDANAAAAAAWGAAGEAAVRKSNAVSLRRGTLAYRPYARRLERRVTALVVLGAVMLAVLGVGLFRASAMQADLLRVVVSSESNLYREVTGAGGAPNTPAMEAALAQARKAASRRGAAPVSCLRRWVDLTKLLPAEGNIQFSRIDFSRQHINFTATAASDSAVWELHRRIGASAVFEQDRQVRTEPLSSGGVGFSMELKYK